MADQRSTEFIEPSRDEIPGISRQHVAAMESSDDERVWVLAGMPHVVVHTVGRRSGREHKVALPFWEDPDGHRIVVASFAGAPRHPAWYLNLQAKPEVLVRVQGRQFWAQAQMLTGEDYDRTWAALASDRPHYDDYRSRTERQIPLVRLVELRPA
jgi:deazaflavin-dependent oxidoreductase (nitroreductase family)